MSFACWWGPIKTTPIIYIYLPINAQEISRHFFRMKFILWCHKAYKVTEKNVMIPYLPSRWYSIPKWKQWEHSG